MLFMSIVILLQSLTLVLSLQFTNVYNMMDRGAFQIFESTMTSRKDLFEREIHALMDNVNSHGVALNKKLQSEAAGTLPLHLLHKDEELYKNVSYQAANSLL